MFNDNVCKLDKTATTLLFIAFNIKGALSGLIHFFPIESPLKMMKNAFYFTSETYFVLKIFKFLS